MWETGLREGLVQVSVWAIVGSEKDYGYIEMCLSRSELSKDEDTIFY